MSDTTENFRKTSQRLTPFSVVGILTCFICGDGQLIARSAFADLVFGEHADVVGGSRVEFNDGGLIQLRGDVFGHLR